MAKELDILRTDTSVIIRMLPTLSSYQHTLRNQRVEELTYQMIAPDRLLFFKGIFNETANIRVWYQTALRENATTSRQPNRNRDAQSFLNS